MLVYHIIWVISCAKFSKICCRTPRVTAHEHACVYTNVFRSASFATRPPFTRFSRNPKRTLKKCFGGSAKNPRKSRKNTPKLFLGIFWVADPRRNFVWEFFLGFHANANTRVCVCVCVCVCKPRARTASVAAITPTLVGFPKIFFKEVVSQFLTVRFGKVSAWDPFKDKVSQPSTLLDCKTWLWASPTWVIWTRSKASRLLCRRITSSFQFIPWESGPLRNGVEPNFFNFRLTDPDCINALLDLLEPATSVSRKRIRLMDVRGVKDAGHVLKGFWHIGTHIKKCQCVSSRHCHGQMGLHAVWAHVGRRQARLPQWHAKLLGVGHDLHRWTPPVSHVDWAELINRFASMQGIECCAVHLCQPTWGRICSTCEHCSEQAPARCNLAKERDTNLRNMVELIQNNLLRVMGNSAQTTYLWRVVLPDAKPTRSLKKWSEQEHLAEIATGEPRGARLTLAQQQPPRQQQKVSRGPRVNFGIWPRWWLPPPPPLSAKSKSATSPTGGSGQGSGSRDKKPPLPPPWAAEQRDQAACLSPPCSASLSCAACAAWHGLANRRYLEPCNDELSGPA